MESGCFCNDFDGMLVKRLTGFRRLNTIRKTIEK